ncbi:hypothetical protein TNCT_40891 [Trichonephila clavata]|uniref:Uncharacterized protein n=1 Tax=Trichonephila clavata TaxID=2740835 RepID=A0A8X6IPS3_TRICU|nr:hypothetical protein TNCT_40891 [Trichonephila clavata]
MRIFLRLFATTICPQKSTISELDCIINISRQYYVEVNDFLWLTFKSTISHCKNDKNKRNTDIVSSAVAPALTNGLVMFAFDVLIGTDTSKHLKWDPKDKNKAVRKLKTSWNKMGLKL